MPPIAQVFAVIAAALHVLFFYFESVTFTRPTVWARFGLHSQAEADIVRPMAFNQGFYNLFLAIGVVVGIGLIAAGSVDAGRAVVLFGCSCMVLAGVVLIATSRAMLRAALIQLVAPLIAIIATVALSG